MPLIPPTDLIEIFSSIQGEGLHVGLRQVFIRFPDCNLHCNYCDTNFQRSATCQVEKDPGSGELVEWENPVALARVVDLLKRWTKRLPGTHHSISITGGEPLLHADLLQEWLPDLVKVLPVYLETNGIMAAELEKIIDLLDWVSMDIKLHSQTGERSDWQAHREFLQIANRVNSYVKVVVGPETTDLELQLSADLVSTVDSSIPIIIQPVTRENQVGIKVKRLLQMQALMCEIHPHVRVIPQTHVFLGAL